jgi:hypothetical protein
LVPVHGVGVDHALAVPAVTTTASATHSTILPCAMVRRLPAVPGTD